MAKNYRKSAVVIPEKASHEDLAAALHELVEDGHISAKVINAKLGSLSRRIHKKVLSVSEVEEQNTKVLTPEQLNELVSVLASRFNDKRNMKRHKGLAWSQVEERLKLQQDVNPEKLWSLNEMERTGGQPDVVDFDQETGAFRFRDCSQESPEGRTYLAYDKAGESEFKRIYPNKRCDGNVLDTAEEMGIEVLYEAEYRAAHQLEEPDKWRSSYLKSTIDVRRAVSGERRGGYPHIDWDFPYICNSVRAFRGALWV